ncbi:MAG: large-conductance mechanosensitive channel protein MscL [Bauldia litoralis]
MLKEFKEFAMRGNVIDMAVGIILGVAFGKIVASLVKDVIMPPIGMLLGGTDFSAIMITLQTVPKPVTVNIGVFINTVIEFVIVAFALFLVIKGMNSMKRKQEEKPEEAPPPPQDVQLLTEIRDLLREREGKPPTSGA